MQAVSSGQHHLAGSSCCLCCLSLLAAAQLQLLCRNSCHKSCPWQSMTSLLHAGIVGAGTNNARLAGMLRQLGSYYYKEPTLLLLVRVAQGLVHLGKGLLTLNPKHANQQLLSSKPLSPVQMISVRTSPLASHSHVNVLAHGPEKLPAWHSPGPDIQLVSIPSFRWPSLCANICQVSRTELRGSVQMWRWWACWWCCMEPWT